MPDVSSDPVPTCVAHVQRRWSEFIESPHGVVFCCAVTPSEYPLVDAVVRLEEDSATAMHPDIMLRFDATVADENYGHTLREQLIARHVQERAWLRETDIPADWEAPPPSDDPVTALIEACSSYHAYHQLPARLVLVLEPQAHRDVAAWEAFVTKFATEAPPTLVLWIYEDATNIQLKRLEDAVPKRFVHWSADLDFPRLMESICGNVTDDDTPSRAFRHAWTQASAALAEQNIETAEQLGDEAIAIAIAQTWPHLAAGMELTLGAALVGDADRVDDALARLDAAEAHALQSDQAGEPSAAIVRLRARMARGSVLLQAQRYPSAAELYETTVPLAEAAEEPRTQLDCWRLAALAHELSGDAESAWICGRKGLDLAHDGDETPREHSTLAHLGVAMERIAQSRDPTDDLAAIDREMSELAGTEDWRPS
ncbi:MAG: hypothetical protein B7733_23115 [Myxococcales bacterium FL481]|nr:MAG: hypothetical protein B7733_23115 [Myxococcales bacterium FL481]